MTESVPVDDTEPKAGRTCILVLGMHRSGTSAVTRALNLMGAALPETVIGADEFNVAGHWEPERLAYLHVAMLDECGSRWDDWRPFRFGELSMARQAHYRRAIREIIAEEYGAARLFVLKDPRICRFVPLYQQVLAEMGIELRYLLAMRDPYAVVRSLETRDRQGPGLAARLWLRHVLDAEMATRGLVRTLGWYEDLLADPGGEVRRIGKELGITWSAGADGEAEVIESLRPELAHHVGVEPWAIAGIGGSLPVTTAALRALDAAPAESATILERMATSLERPGALEIDNPWSDNLARGTIGRGEMGEHNTIERVERPEAEPKVRTSADIYVFEVDPESDTAGANVLRLVGRNKDVLELGAGPGSIARPLVERNGCRVTALEADIKCLPILRRFCSAVHQGDLNDRNWHSVFNDQSFDTIVIADVLEHLVDPWETLRGARRLLRPGGAVVSSIPNASHSALVASLLNEDVDYREWGLLDRTHVRFFGLKNIQTLFQQAGLKIVDARYVTRAPEETEFAETWWQTPQATRDALEERPFSQVYQTVVMAIDAASTLPMGEFGLLEHPPAKRQAPMLQRNEATARAVNGLRQRVGKALGPRGRAIVKRVLGMKS